ncbi:Plasma membrane ATPase [Hordeum vulgare]|nr:Plasma membrane ATPase [Hordeum vulgare]
MLVMDAEMQLIVQATTLIAVIRAWDMFMHKRLHWGNRWYSCHFESVEKRSAHDANIPSDNMSHPDDINIPNGKFYLEDASYACLRGVLPPLKKTRYYLIEFSRRNYPRTLHELFNLKQSNLRVTIERAFEALRNELKIMNQTTSALILPRLSLFLHIAFRITGFCNRVKMNWCVRRRM